MIALLGTSPGRVAGCSEPSHRPRPAPAGPRTYGAWVQIEPPGTARVGRVVLCRQAAYATRYQVRLAGPADARFIRVQGIHRATKFGYSPWSVAARAVASGSR